MDDANSTPTDFLAALMGMWAAGSAAVEAETVVAAPVTPVVPAAEPVVERFESGAVRVTMHGVEYERGAKVRGRIVRWFSYSPRAHRVTNADTLIVLNRLAP